MRKINSSSIYLPTSLSIFSLDYRHYTNDIVNYTNNFIQKIHRRVGWIPWDITYAVVPHISIQNCHISLALQNDILYFLLMAPLTPNLLRVSLAFERIKYSSSRRFLAVINLLNFATYEGFFLLCFFLPYRRIIHLRMSRRKIL